MTARSQAVRLAMLGKPLPARPSIATTLVRQRSLSFAAAITDIHYLGTGVHERSGAILRPRAEITRRNPKMPLALGAPLAGSQRHAAVCTSPLSGSRSLPLIRPSDR